MDRMIDIPLKAINRINHEIGEDIKQLGKCNKIINEYRERVIQIEGEVIYFLLNLNEII